MRTSNYGKREFMRNVCYLLKTKIEFPTARLVRYPITVRGKKYIDFGENLTLGRRAQIEVNGDYHQGKSLLFGKNVNIGNDFRVSCTKEIHIGNSVLIGSRVLIIDNGHGNYSGNMQDSPNTPPNERELTSSPVNIEDNVWIGEGVVIQQGVTIGFGSIIGANSVVTKSIPANCLAAGIPAKVIKKYDAESGEWRRV